MFDPWVGILPWRRACQPTPVFLPGESHGQRGLVGYSPQGQSQMPLKQLSMHTDTLHRTGCFLICGPRGNQPPAHEVAGWRGQLSPVLARGDPSVEPVSSVGVSTLAPVCPHCPARWVSSPSSTRRLQLVQGSCTSTAWWVWGVRPPPAPLGWPIPVAHPGSSSL